MWYVYVFVAYVVSLVVRKVGRDFMTNRSNSRGYLRYTEQINIVFHTPYQVLK